MREGDGVNCQSCGAENPDFYRFCSRCGSGIGAYANVPKRQVYDRICPSCGRQIEWYAVYCPFCGYGATQSKDFKGSMAILILLIIFFWPAAIIYYIMESK